MNSGTSWSARTTPCGHIIRRGAVAREQLALWVGWGGERNSAEANFTFSTLHSHRGTEEIGGQNGHSLLSKKSQLSPHSPPHLSNHTQIQRQIKSGDYSTREQPTDFNSVPT